jgi:hypothetical protein
MIGALLLILMAGVGLVFILNGQPGPLTIAGWAMILYPAIRLPFILKGVAGWGKLIAFAMAVAVAAYVVSGDRWLWDWIF